MDSNIVFVMGVSGCGKSTVGKLLAERLGYPFFDGDDYHLKSHVEKMASGKPLTDKDRLGWLLRLNQLAKGNARSGVVITCSALKQSYRLTLCNDIEGEATFVYLSGTFDEINDRLQKRTDHFMPTGLLQSQFETLEPPTDAICVSIKSTPGEIVSKILLKLQGG
tara:strand:+ start:2468 stop:2962 length:495 start_codon:yes stop_codon:yes gene_type:complete